MASRRTYYLNFIFYIWPILYIHSMNFIITITIVIFSISIFSTLTVVVFIILLYIIVNIKYSWILVITRTYYLRLTPEQYAEPCEPCRLEHFAKIDLTVFSLWLFSQKTLSMVLQKFLYTSLITHSKISLIQLLIEIKTLRLY